MSEDKLPVVKSITDLAALGQKGVPELLKQVVGKIAGLTGGKVNTKTTKGTRLPGFDEIQNITKVSVLIQAMSSIRAREKAYGESAKELNLSTIKFPFKLEGFTAKQWIDDIKVKVGTLSNKAELDKLNKIKEKLESNLSAKDKLKKDMEEVARILTEDGPLE